MSEKINRRSFVKTSLLTTASASMALSAGKAKAKPVVPAASPLPTGKIGDLNISRLLLGGNLLTHYTHSRDLKYVYNLTARYNTDEKIRETLEVAESNGVNTLVIHTVDRALNTLKAHRKNGGKMQWIICTTAPVNDDMTAYTESVKQLVDDGTEAIYLWGVHADRLVSQGKVGLVERAVEVAKDLGVPSGVGGHDLRVVRACEETGIANDFYIKTFHHHRYASAPRLDELNRPYREVPGYWCNDPDAVWKQMAKVEKPWIAFKVMAAGAIPPRSAFKYVFEKGADFILAGMFDFEIEEDARIVNTLLVGDLKRNRAWQA